MTSARSPWQAVPGAPEPGGEREIGREAAGRTASDSSDKSFSRLDGRPPQEGGNVYSFAAFPLEEGQLQASGTASDDDALRRSIDDGARFLFVVVKRRLGFPDFKAAPFIALDELGGGARPGIEPANGVGDRRRRPVPIDDGIAPGYFRSVTR